MKTTVKLDNMKALSIEPKGASIELAISVGLVPAYRQSLTLDQAGAILFAIEQAAEIAERNRSAIQL